MKTLESQSQISPMMQRYQSIKAQLPAGTLLLIRLGDFYEAFFADAETISRALNLALTKRRDVTMCGIPHHAIEKYSSKLTLAGFKVALLDETPSLS